MLLQLQCYPLMLPLPVDVVSTITITPASVVSRSAAASTEATILGL